MSHRKNSEENENDETMEGLGYHYRVKTNFTNDERNQSTVELISQFKESPRKLRSSQKLGESSKTQKNIEQLKSRPSTGKRRTTKNESDFSTGFKNFMQELENREPQQSTQTSEELENSNPVALSEPEVEVPISQNSTVDPQIHNRINWQIVQKLPKTYQKATISIISIIITAIVYFCIRNSDIFHNKKTYYTNIFLENVYNFSFPITFPFWGENNYVEINTLDIDKYITDYLMKYDADKTSQSDFALESVGGKILSIGDTIPFKSKTMNPFTWLWDKFSTSPEETARPLIQSNMAPGQCWAFQGHRGEVTIQLLGSVHISEVSLEHISSSISPTGEISSAPRTFQIYGLNDIHDPGIMLGSFEYKKNGLPLQFFKVSDSGPFNAVKMMINSNWGNKAYTCVYRLRVHGTLVKK